MKVDQKEILTEVCNYFDIDPYTLFSMSRLRRIVQPRQVFFYLCTRYTSLPLIKIGEIALLYDRGKAIGHDNIIYMRRNVKNYLEINDPVYTHPIETISKNIQESHYNHALEKVIPNTVNLLGIAKMNTQLAQNYF